MRTRNRHCNQATTANTTARASITPSGGNSAELSSNTHKIIPVIPAMRQALATTARRDWVRCPARFRFTVASEMSIPSACSLRRLAINIGNDNTIAAPQSAARSVSGVSFHLVNQAGSSRARYAAPRITPATSAMLTAICKIHLRESFDARLFHWPPLNRSTQSLYNAR